jgi:hypothetical protein
LYRKHRTDPKAGPETKKAWIWRMADSDKHKASRELRDRINAMSRGKKIVLVVFIIWAIQAIPKWTAAIVADGETSAAIMTFFITPR